VVFRPEESPPTLALAGSARPDLAFFAPWAYSAAAYNFAWGLVNILFPGLFFDLLRIQRPNYLPIWQVIGMFVLVYAPAYFWTGRHPDRYPYLIVLGLLGKVLGPIGYLWAITSSDFPVLFGVAILTNDLIWWPSFVVYLRRAARRKGGWQALLLGD
jgi:hypothetical protein